MAGFDDAAAGLERLKRGLAQSLEGAGGASGRMKAVRGFGFNPGGLQMLTYAPEGLAAGAPLVVVLHGCTQDAEAHAAAGGWLTLADRLGFVVLAPEQTAANNPNRCFNWFEPGDTRRGEGEAASIAAMVAHCVRAHGLDPARVFVTGLSAGGAMAAAMLAAYPEVFAGGAVVAGLPYGAAGNMQEAFGAMQGRHALSGAELGALVRGAGPAGAPLPRLTIWQGDADRTVHPRNGEVLARQWATAHGLAERPDAVERLANRVRSVWRSAGGEAVLEYNLVQGLGHGTPLATAGEEGLGHAAPFMIEAGVSASLETARFWGLAPAGAVEAARPGPAPAREPTATAIGDGVLSAIGGRVPAEVQSTIERALKRAGLMR